MPETNAPPDGAYYLGFDGGGMIPVLEDTNDIGFQAVAVKDGFGVEPGIWF